MEKKTGAIVSGPRPGTAGEGGRSGAAWMTVEKKTGAIVSGPRPGTAGGGAGRAGDAWATVQPGGAMEPCGREGIKLKWCLSLPASLLPGRGGVPPLLGNQWSQRAGLGGV